MQKLSQIRLPKKRRSSILQILEGFDNQHIASPERNIPMDIFLRYYFLDHKNEFDNEARNQIVEIVYTL